MYAHRGVGGNFSFENRVIFNRNFSFENPKLVLGKTQTSAIVKKFSKTSEKNLKKYFVGRVLFYQTFSNPEKKNFC